MTTKEQEMRKALQCLYLQVPESVADDVKKKVLAAYDEIKSESPSNEVKELVEALDKAVEVIKAWHNMGEVFPFNETHVKSIWDIYYNQSPEMKPIREALTNYKNKTNG